MDRRSLAAAAAVAVASAAFGAWAADKTSSAPAKDKKPAAAAEDGLPPASTQEQIDKMDNGPDTIDVSKYPKEQQSNYLVFAARCSKCHTLARPINSPYALPEEWDAYVKKMSRKPRSGLDGDGDEKKKIRQQIIDFLTYDSSVRKKDAIEAKRKAKGKPGAKEEKSSKPKDGADAKPGS